MSAALELIGLEAGYRTRAGLATVLRGVSLAIAPGESYGLVGESGCGKSTVAYAALGALPENAVVGGGRVLIDGTDVRALDAAGLRALRARRVAMVFQDPGRALNPAMRVGRQLAEAFEVAGAGRRQAAARAAAMLERVRIAEPARVMRAWPHQLSGGMQQRVVIGMALARDPALLVLDEPTTGLDATVAAEVLELIAGLRREFGTAVLFISHDLGVIGRMCDRIGVLYAGSLVEEGPAAALLAGPLHPYTQRLLRCLPAAGQRKADGRLDSIPGFLPPPGAPLPGCVFAPRCHLADARCRAEVPPPRAFGAQMARCHYVERARAEPAPLPPALPPPAAAAGVTLDGRDVAPGVALRAVALSKTFRGGQRAVADVSFELARGETLGLVGGSGSGKTTLARLLLGLAAPDPGGRVELGEQMVPARTRARSAAAHKALQVVFQNPDSALNRAHRVRRLLARPLARLAGLAGAAREQRLRALLDAVRLSPRELALRPRQLSGGMKQRVAIARAFAGDPSVVICDEPTSSLDVSVQGAILNLLAELQEGAGVSYLFISHDLGVVRYLADRIAVLYRGRLVELGPAEDVFRGPHHPYTEALLAAVPGREGAAAAAADGCVFHPSCPRKIGAVCETTTPAMHTDTGHEVRCHLPAAALGRAGVSPPAAVRR